MSNAVRLSGNPIIDAARVAEKASGAPIFLGVPRRWYDPPSWRCDDGHVSARYLKTDDGDRCLGCGAPVYLTFPEDREEQASE